MSQAEAVTVLEFDARPATAGAEEYARAGEKIINIENAVVAATERRRKPIDNTERAYAKLARQLDPLAAKQQALERGLGIIEARHRSGNLVGEKYNRMLELLNQRYKQNEAANDSAGKGMGRFSQAVGQGGLQMQDLAVQLASGTSAFVALGQQLPQFLGIFGTGGAIAGAVVAVAALAANFLTMGDAGEKVASVQKKIIGDLNNWTGSVRVSIDVHEAFSNVLERIKRIQEELPGLSQRSAAAIKAETANVIAMAQARVMDAEARLTARKQALEMEKGAANDTMGATNAPMVDQINLVDEAKKKLTSMRIELDLLRAAAGEFAGERGIGLVNRALEGASGGVSVAQSELEKAKKRAQEALGILQDSVAASDRVLVDAIKQQQDGARVAESVRTTWEVWADEQQRLNGLLSAGAINAETFARAMNAANPIVKMQADLLDMLQSAVDKDFGTITKEFDIQVAADFKAALSKGDLGEALRKPLVSALDRAAQGAADSFGNIFTRLQAGNWDGVTEQVGVFQDRMRILEEQTGSSSEAFKEMGKNLLDSAEAGNALGNLLGSLFGRDADQKKNAQIGGAVGGTAASMLGLPKGLGAFVGNLIGGLFGGNAKEDAYWRQRSADLDTLGESLSGFIARTANISGVAQQFNALDEEFAGLRAEAQRLGQPIDALTRSYEAQRRALRDQVANDNVDRMWRATGQEWRAELRALTSAHATAINDALIAEVDLSTVRAANAAELAAFFEGFTTAQLLAMGSLVTQLDIVNARIRDLTSGAGDWIDKQLDAARQVASATRSQAQALRQLADSLRNQVLSNKVGDLSPLSPTAKYDALSVEFTRLEALAKAGNADAIGQLGGVGTQLLEAGRLLYASGPAYADLFARVNGILDQVAVNADVRATVLDRIADLAEIEVGLLTDLREVLTSNLGQPTAQAIAAAISDGVLTVGEIQGINAALTDLGNRFAGVTGPAADAVRLSIEGLRPLLTAGALTDAQKTALSTGQGAVAQALEAFRSTQIDEYRDALIAAGNAMAALQNFVLDVDGQIPAAIAAAFDGVGFDATLIGSINGLFTRALYGEAGAAAALPVALITQAGTIVGDVIGTTALPVALITQAGAIVGDVIGTAALPVALITQAGTIVRTVIGTTAVGGESSLTYLADGTIRTAIGTDSVTALTSLINTQFGNAVTEWSSSTDPRPLTVRINEIFARSLGATAGETWQGALRTYLDQQSPLVTALEALKAQLPLLAAAISGAAAQNAAQAIWDAGLQAAVNPVRAGVSAAAGTLTGARQVEAGSKMISTWYGVDASSGAITARGGKDSDSASNARADALAQGLSGLARQIEALTGGNLTSFDVNAGNKYGSGYNMLQYGIDKAQAFGINDFAAIARSFITDALSVLEGGNAAAIDILKQQDYSNLTAGFVSATQAIYEAANPRPQVTEATAAPVSAADALLSRFDEARYLAANADVMAAVNARVFASGREHFTAYGMAEVLSGQRVPGFAHGGYHPGGLRLVGERGPELEVTGPARYFPAEQTARMMRTGSDGADRAAIDRLGAEVKALRGELRQQTQAMVAGQQGIQAAVQGQVAAVQEQTAVQRRRAG